MTSVTNISSEVLNLDEQPLVDSSIDQQEFQEVVLSNLNAANTFNFYIDYTDQWILPCEAYLQLRGKIVKAADGAEYAAGDDIALANNGILQAFNIARYKINNQIIEEVNSPGEASLITGLVDYSDDYINMMGDQICMAKDAGANNTAATNTGFAKRKAMTWVAGTGHRFDFCIPLSHIFRFCKDIRKVFYGLTHTIELIKGDVDNAIMRAAAADAGKIEFTAASLWYPRITPSLKEQQKLISWLNSKKTFDALFQQVKHYSINYDATMTRINWNITNFTGSSERPRHVFIAFQLQAKQGNQEQNAAVFDALAVSDISLTVNNDRVPSIPYTIDFTNNAYSRVYKDLLNYRGVDNAYDGGMLITRSDFKDRYSVYHFDLENSKTPLNNSTSTLQLRASLNAGNGNNYRVVAVILSDRELTFKSDGEQMTLSYN